MYLEEAGAGSRTGASKIKTANWQTKSASAGTGAKTETTQPKAAWEQGKLHETRAKAETIAPYQPGEPTLGERILTAIPGAVKTYGASVLDAPRVTYEYGQGARDEMNGFLLEGAQRALENAQNDYRQMLRDGADERDIWSQRNIIEDWERKANAYEKASGIQRGATRETAKLVNDLNASGAADRERALQGANIIDRAIIKTGIAGGQMAIDAGVGALTGTGAMLPMLVRSFGNGTMQAKQKGYDTNQQMQLGLASMATEYFTEKLFGGNPAYDTDAGLVNKLVGEVTKDKAWSETLTKALASRPAQTLSEGLEEVAADILEPLGELAATGNWSGYELSEIIEDGVVGIMLGGLAQGVQTAAGEAARSDVWGKSARQLVSKDNVNRYRAAIDQTFSGDYPSGKLIQMGETPEILLQYGASQRPLTMTQSTAYKIAYPEGYFGGKHNLGMSVLKRLPHQIADPVAILKSNTQPDSLVLLTEWKDGDKNIIVPVHLNSQGTIEVTNKVASAYGKSHIDSILGANNANVLYTKNGKDIHQLLSKGVQFPQAMADDILAKNSVPKTKQSVNAKIYLAALRKLPVLTAEQRMTLERWNLRFPEMSMSPEEFLGR